MPTDTDSRDLFYVKLFTGLITAAIVVYFLKELQHLFLPFFLALFLYFLFNGLVQRLLDHHLPKFIVLTFLLVLIFVVIYLFGLLVYTGATSFVNEFPAYSGKITDSIQKLLVRLRIPLKDVNRYINQIDWKSILNPERVTTVISSTLGSFTTFVGNLSLVLLFLMFMLGGRTALFNRINKSQPEERSRKLFSIIDSIDREVQRYLVIKTALSIVLMGIGTLILYLGKIDFLIFAALLIFLCNYIPTYGSVVSTLFPFLIGFIQYGFGFRLFLVTVSLMVMQLISGNVIEPKITGKRLNLSPITILISLIFWGWLWGIIGMILAVPITSAIKIIFEHVPSLKPIAMLMSSE